MDLRGDHCEYFGALLVFVNWSGGVLTPEIWTVCMMAAADHTCHRHRHWSLVRRAFILVMMWALFGIYLTMESYQQMVMIPVSALVMEIALVGALIYHVCQKESGLTFFVEVELIEMFAGYFIEAFLDQLAVAMNVDVKILVKFQHALEYPRLSLNSMR